MGTNFYLHQRPDCETCGRPFVPLHIGKSSAGWCFSLHVIPEDGIHGLEDWRQLWSKHRAYIRNEYGERISIPDIEATITAREVKRTWSDSRWWKGFYASEEQFHSQNNSQRGPSGLLRCRLSKHCPAHGEGTWDCIVGEFS